MKNMKKSIAILLVLILSVSVFASCGGSSLSGKYFVTEVEGDDGKLIKVEDYVNEVKAMYEEYGMEFDESEIYSVFEGNYIEFFKDGKFKIVAIDEDDVDGTYKVDGKTITLINPDEDDGEIEIKGKIDGKKIIFEEEYFKAVFEKK